MNVPASPLTLTRAAGFLALAIGLVAFFGWLLDIPPLRSVLTGPVEMKANTAIGLTLASGALLLCTNPAVARAATLARVLALGVLALGAGTLSQHVFGWRLGIDELMFRDPGLSFDGSPGRMSPYGATTFVAIGLALLFLLQARQRQLVMWLAAVPALVGLFGLVGYAWNSNEVLAGGPVPRTVPPTGLAFLLLGLGLMVANHARHASAAATATAPLRATIEFKVAIGFLFAFLLLTVGGGIIYRSSTESGRSAQQVVHTQEVRGRLAQFYARASDAESAGMAYVLSGGNPRHEEDFTRFAADAEREATALRALIADNPAQQTTQARLDDLLAQRMRSLQEGIAAHHRGDVDAARQAVAAQAAMQVMATARGVVREMDRHEAGLLVQREERFRESRRTSLLLLVPTIFLSLGIFALLLRNIRKEMLARASADERVQRLNADLEQRVEERTAELERTNAALQSSSELYRHTLDSMLEGCQIVGFDWRLRYVNAGAARRIGMRSDVLIGRTLTEVYPGIERTELFAQLRRTMEERLPKRGETEFILADGRGGWFQYSVLPTAEGISVFVIDITERKRAEQEITAINAALEQRIEERTTELVQAREAADAANRAKSAFLATMSHEIRTPMNGVIGMVEVLARSPLSEPQVDAVHTIRSSAFSLLRIIDDVLDFSKIEAGRLELEQVAVGLQELVEGICATLLPVALDKDVDLNLFLDPRLPVAIEGDPTRLRQVLFNLAGNAIKFSAGREQRRGRVSVRAELVPEAPPAFACA